MIWGYLYGFEPPICSVHQVNRSPTHRNLPTSYSQVVPGLSWAGFNPQTMVGDVGDEITDLGPFSLVVFDRNIGYWDGIRFLFLNMTCVIQP